MGLNVRYLVTLRCDTCHEVVQDFVGPDKSKIIKEIRELSGWTVKKPTSDYVVKCPFCVKRAVHDTEQIDPAHILDLQFSVDDDIYFTEL